MGIRIGTIKYSKANDVLTEEHGGSSGVQQDSE